MGRHHCGQEGKPKFQETIGTGRCTKRETGDWVGLLWGACLGFPSPKPGQWLLLSGGCWVSVPVRGQLVQSLCCGPWTGCSSL